MSYSEIYNHLQDNDIFATLQLTINVSSSISSNMEDWTNEKKLYEIKSIDVKNKKNEFKSDNVAHIMKFINYINEIIKSNDGFKPTDRGWSLFFLLKEMISYFQNNNFNYFRGQRSDWKTVPSIFRNFKNENGSMYYEEFEKIYSNIQKKFPEKIKYVNLSGSKENIREKITERSKELALLQHYGIKTSLLDITSNPYIAMLFMISGELLNNFQLELYSIDDDCLLFTDVEFSNLNKRIVAQKGAFLNYDFLIEEQFRKSIDKNKIQRIKINVLYSDKNNIDDIKQQLNKLDSLKKIKGENYGDEEFKIVTQAVELLRGDKKKKILLNIQEHLKRKLKEFGYEEFELFPDFEYYLKYRMSLYKDKK